MKAIRAVWKARHRALALGLPVGDLTKEAMARIHLLPCAYCGVMPAMGADHVIPFARGGLNTIANLAPSCLRCNHRKHAKLAIA
jgi:5-methylcytosine-specific restriction endonuclease McrA